MKKTFTILLSFFLTINLAYAQNVDVNKYQIESENLNETREVWVGLPENYDATISYPTMYVLDAETQFDISYAIMKELATNDKIPKHIVIGIPYVDSPHRFKDLSFTTTEYNSSGEHDSIVAQFFENQDMGGAPKFYNYLTDEVMPFVDGLHLTNGFDVFIGHSLSGYFGAYILTMDSPFNAYQLYDPSIWYNQADPTKHFLETFPENLKSNVFISSANGGRERQQYNIDTQREFHELLLENGINSELKVYNDEDHGSVRLPSLIDGLSGLYKGYAIGMILPTDTITVADVQKHYQDFSKKVNYNFAPTVDAFRWTGFVNYIQGNWTAAIDAYRLCSVLYPTDVNLLSEFAECYYKLEEYQLSLEVYEKAFAITESNEAVNLKIEELKELIAKK